MCKRAMTERIHRDKKWRERERGRHRDKDSETERDGVAEKQTYIYMGRDRETQRGRHREGDRRTDSETDRRRQTERQASRQAERDADVPPAAPDTLSTSLSDSSLDSWSGNRDDPALGSWTSSVCIMSHCEVYLMMHVTYWLLLQLPPAPGVPG